MEWSNDGELLAIAGHVRLPNQDCHNELRFYRRSTRLQMSLVLPSQASLEVQYLCFTEICLKIFFRVLSIPFFPFPSLSFPFLYFPHTSVMFSVDVTLVYEQLHCQ